MKPEAEFRNLIENWHISDFHISDARPSIEEGISEHLSTRGDNVAQVAQFLFENHRPIFEEILSVMKRRIPGVNNVDAKPTEDGRIVLRFHDGSFKDPFIARYVSDGTIKMFAYLVLLYDPGPFPLLAIEEPENQLYPELLYELSDRDRSRDIFLGCSRGRSSPRQYRRVKSAGFTAVSFWIRLVLVVMRAG